MSDGIQDPVAKLRYLRSSLARQEAAGRTVAAVPFAPVRRGVYRWISLLSLRPALRTGRFGGPAPVDEKTRKAYERTRLAGLMGAVLASLLVAAGAWHLSDEGRLRVDAAAQAATAPSRVLPPVESLPPRPAAISPAGIWIVETGGDYEQYSNGLRIDTSHAVTGDPRSYRVFTEAGGLGPDVLDRPVGLLFHTTESDVWPLEASFNESLRDSSQRLLRYLQRNRLYHYLIDRFGRVYRVVDEGSKANHAGNSIWASGDTVFLNLNHAFLAVAFETRWEGGQALPITQAQLAAGQALTAVLRARYGIAPDMCVAHGLTSVNPSRHLIGHHLDWARGFPFEAFGLPDQYARATPSVARFGFRYDEGFLRVLGEPWPGVVEAERELAAEAARRSTDVDRLRKERQALYDRWLKEQRSDQGILASGQDSPPERASGARGG